MNTCTLENTITPWPSAGCYNADIDNPDTLLLGEIGCMPAERDIAIPISSFAHEDNANAGTAIIGLGGEDGSIAESNCIEVAELPCHLSLPYSSAHDELETGYNGVQTVFALSRSRFIDAAVGCIPRQTHRDGIATVNYKCNTQGRGCAEVRVGWEDEIPRWRRGSELTYVVCVESFPASLSSTIEGAMKAAIDEWQGHSFVSFKQVRRNDPATFAVIYENRDGKPYACSFFPNEPDGLDRKLVVFARCLQVPDCLANILSHEIGHILGLRHEFAHKHREERQYPSILIGGEDTQSVMNYFKHPSQLQVKDKDIEGLRRFYESDQTEYEGTLVRDIDPEVRLTEKMRR